MPLHGPTVDRWRPASIPRPSCASYESTKMTIPSHILSTLQAAHSQLIEGRQKLLDHMSVWPEAYRQTESGLEGFRAISNAERELSAVIEKATIDAILGDATNG